MTSPNTRPEWGCSQWDDRDHNWHDCPDCMEAHEMIIEKAQDEWEDVPMETKSAPAE